MAGPENLRQQSHLLLPGYEEMKRIKESAGRFAIPVGGHWVERDVLHISEAISERWPTLRVWSCTCGHCLDHPDPTRRHFPHKVVEMLEGGGMADVFGFTEFGEHVIQHLYAIDSQVTDPWEVQEQENRKIRRAREKEERARQREALEPIEAALRSRKYHWKGPDGLYTDPWGGGRR